MRRSLLFTDRYRHCHIVRGVSFSPLDLRICPPPLVKILTQRRLETRMNAFILSNLLERCTALDADHNAKICQRR